MRFVPVKTAEQQAALMLVGVRERLIRKSHPARQRHPGLCGGVRSDRRQGARQGRAALGADRPGREPAGAGAEMFTLQGRNTRSCRRTEGSRGPADGLASRRRQPAFGKDSGVGLIGATMLVMKTPDPQMFRSGRHFAAWIGLTPKDHSTAGKTRLGVITRAGDEVLRSVLVAGPLP